MKIGELVDFSEFKRLQDQAQAAETDKKDLYKPVYRAIEFQKRGINTEHKAKPLVEEDIFNADYFLKAAHLDTLDRREPTQIYREMRPMMQSVLHT